MTKLIYFMYTFGQRELVNVISVIESNYGCCQPCLVTEMSHCSGIKGNGSMTNKHCH